MNAAFDFFRFFTLALIISVANFAAAQEVPYITATVDRNQMRIADPFTVTLKVVAAEGSRVQFPEISNEFGPFEVIDQSEQFGVPTMSDSSTQTWTLTLLLETLETGQLEFPAVEVVVSSASYPEKSRRIRSKPVSMTVDSSIEAGSDPTVFHDIRDVIDAPIEPQQNGSNLIWTIVTAMSVIAVAATATLWLVSRQRNRTTPGQWATDQLADRSGLTLSDVDDIFRAFIADEFEQPAHSWTDGAFADFAAEMKLSTERWNSLQAFLFKAQQEKFAGLIVSDEELNSATDAVVELISELEQKNLGVK